MKPIFKTFSFEKSLADLDKMLDDNRTDVEEINSLPEESDETCEKSLYAYCSVIYVDIRMKNDWTNATKRTISDKINIRYDGNVYPCEVFKDDMLNKKIEHEPDNVSSASFLDIYNKSSYLNAVRKQIDAFKLEDGDETCYGQFKMLDL